MKLARRDHGRAHPRCTTVTPQSAGHFYGQSFVAETERKMCDPRRRPAVDQRNAALIELSASAGPPPAADVRTSSAAIYSLINRIVYARCSITADLFPSDRIRPASRLSCEPGGAPVRLRRTRRCRAHKSGETLAHLEHCGNSDWGPEHDRGSMRGINWPRLEVRWIYCNAVGFRFR